MAASVLYVQNFYLNNAYVFKKGRPETILEGKYTDVPTFCMFRPALLGELIIAFPTVTSSSYQQHMRYITVIVLPGSSGSRVFSDTGRRCVVFKNQNQKR